MVAVPRGIEPVVLELLSYFPAVGIVGPRQVGKTTLAKQVMRQLAEPTVYFDLESETDLVQLTNPTLVLRSHQDSCVVIDEIQRMPALFPLLRSLIDEHRVPGRFILLSSASPRLIRDSSESLAGRIAYQELYPLSRQETRTLSEIDTATHWLRGGFPDSLLAPSEHLSC